jgi:hypothetical protein
MPKAADMVQERVNPGREREPSGQEARGVSDSGLDRLTSMADASQQVSGLQQLSAKADARPDAGGSVPASPGAGASVSIDQELLLLQGELSLGAKFLSLMGQDTSFKEMIDVVARYSQAKKPEEKASIRPQVISTGQKWIGRHKDPKNDNDRRKKTSIERIVSALQVEGRQVELASMDDKVTTGAKIKEAVLGSPSSFQQIQPIFESYQQSATGEIASFDAFVNVFRKAWQVKDAIRVWRDKHGSSKDPDDVEKLRTLNLMESQLGQLEVGVQVPPYFKARASGIDVGALTEQNFRVREVTLEVTLASGVATGTLKNAAVTPQGFQFSELNLQFSGDLQVTEGFRVTAPELVIRSLSGGYSITGSGGLFIDAPAAGPVDKLTAEGQVSIGYDFATRKIIDPVIRDASLSVGLFGCMHMKVQGLSYASGVFTATSGEMSVTAMEKTFTGSVSDIRYARPEGFSFATATISSADRFEPVSGLFVEGPALTLEKTAAGWDIHGSGRLGIEAGMAGLKINKAEANVSVTYGLAEGAVKSFNVSDGTMDVTLFNALNLNVKGVGYDESTKALTASEGAVSLTFYGQTLTASAKDISYAKEKGIDFSSVTLSGADVYEPLPGIRVEQPTLTLERGGAGGWLVKGTGKIAFNLSDGGAIVVDKAEAGIEMVYDTQRGAIDTFTVSEGAIDITAFDHVALSGSGISFDKATGLLTMGSVSVSLTGLDFLGGGSFSGTGTNVVIGKDTFDWDRLEVGINREFSVGSFKFTPPLAVIEKSADGYKVLLQEMQGRLGVGEWLEVSGSASAEWAPGDGVVPRITEAALDAQAKGIDLFGTFVPFFEGGASFSTGFTIPFATPVPMEASVTIGGHAKATVDLALALRYANDAIEASGNVTMNPELGLYIKVGAGVGSSMLVYIGAYIKGAITAQATASLGFSGRASLSGGYNMESLEADYDIGAKMSASLSAGGEVKVLYFFEKELYEFTFKTWDLGESHIKGGYDLLNRKPIRDESTQIFQDVKNPAKKGEALGIPPPKNELRSKNYTRTINALNRALEDIEMPDSELTDEKGAAAIARHRTRIKGSFDRLITQATSKKDALSLKQQNNRQQIDQYAETQRGWLTRQEGKLAEANKKASHGFSFSLKSGLHRQSPEWYEKKIDQGKARYEQRLATKQQLLQKIETELDTAETELDLSTRILARLDEILKPEGSLVLDSIIAEVNARRARLEEALDKGAAAENVAPEVFEFEDKDVV